MSSVTEDWRREAAASVIELSRLALAFGRVDRITYHDDGTTPESDTDHTVMLGLVACAFAHVHLPELDRGRIAQYALVHDLVEVYAGDTQTLQITEAGQRAKRAREADALLRLGQQFAVSLPWVGTNIAEYELLRTPEARYVKALDKLLPKITHILNRGRVFDDLNMSEDEVQERYDRQLGEIESYAADFPLIFDLRAELLRLVKATCFPASSTHRGSSVTSPTRGLS
jgi:putative hydrolase of HD superfamily